MPTKKVNGWKYGKSATFKKKPTKVQKAAIHASKDKKKKGAKKK